LKKKTKWDFLAINRRMNGNFNGGENQFTGRSKKITKGEEMKLNQKELNLTKCKSR
jgi:hypothetical protein